MFIGRENELTQLAKFADRPTAGLVVCSGRRRVGKSTLIEKFAEDCGRAFYEFYGLSPRDEISNQSQLDHFGVLMGEKFNVPAMRFTEWHEALSTLAGLTSQEPCIILLDEISWLAGTDPDFPGKLKGIWDTKFKKNNQLILVLCGSVSSWIRENILNDRGFMGRVSLEIALEELPLSKANLFWGEYSQHISAYEKFKLLCVTGGIPRYLEEINPKLTTEQNIKRLCFSKGGVLVNEFDKIFNDIFLGQSELYKSIVKTVVHKGRQIEEICEHLGVEQSGHFNRRLQVLCESQFLARDYVWQDGKKSKKLSKFRLKDNYLRFYLKYIEPKRDLIEQGIYEEFHIEDFSDWHSIMGLQFENLVLNNLKYLLKVLDVNPINLLSAAPYFQNQTKRQLACQIDLLIQTKFCIYVCEMKFSNKISIEVINQVAEKIRRLKVKKTISIRPVLIYQGELSEPLKQSNFFSHFISFDQMLVV